MATARQQVFKRGSAWNISALLLILLGQGCREAPARSKPWRHHRDAGDLFGQRAPRAAPPESGLPAQSLERKSTLRIHLDADPGSLHPVYGASVWAQRIMRQTVFESLIRYRASRRGPAQYAPALAQSWRVQSRGRELRFELSPGAHFHDGEPVTAADVQFSIDSARHPRKGDTYYRRALADIRSVEILGPRALRIRLRRPSGYVLRTLAELSILPEHVYAKKWRTRSGPWIGSGPYRVASDDSQGVVLERVADYWGPAPAIERVVFLRERDAAEAVRAAKSEELDILPSLIPEHVPDQLHTPAIAQHFGVVRLRPATFSALVLNTRRPPFDDARVRRAVAHLINREGLVALRSGLAHSVSLPIWPGGPGDGKSLAPVPYDEAAAARLLEAAGWSSRGDASVRRRGGARLMVAVLTTEKEHLIRDEVLRSLRKAGFVVDLRVGPPAVLRNRLRDAEFGMAFVEWSGAADRDLSPLFQSGGALNYGRFRDAEVDDVLARLRLARQPAERSPLLDELARLLRRQQPMVALPAPDPRGLVHRRVRGLHVTDAWFHIPDLSLAPLR